MPKEYPAPSAIERGSTADSHTAGALPVEPEGLRALAEALPGPALLIAEGRIVLANGIAAARLGYPTGEALHGVDFASVLAAEDLPAWKEAQSVLRTESVTPLKCGLVLETVEGGRFPSAFALRSTSWGGREAILAVAAGGGPGAAWPGASAEAPQTAEPSVGSQVAVLPSQGWVSDMLEHLPTMVCAFDAAGRVVFWNRECVRVSGYEPEEVVGSADALELLFPDVGQRDALLYAIRKRVENSGQREARLRTRSGEEHTLSWCLSPAQAAVPGWHAWIVASDVSFHRAEMQRLQEREHRMERLQDLTHLGTWELDLQHDMLQGSEAFGRIWGVDVWPSPASSFLEKTIHPGDRDRIREAVRSGIMNGATFEEYFRIIRPSDGEERVLHTVATVLRDAAGWAVLVTGATRDITEEKRFEQQLLDQRRAFEVVQSMGNIGVWSRDIETGRLDWSDQTYRIFGMEPQERQLVLDDLLPMTHPEDLELLRRSVRPVDGDTRPNDYEHRIVRPDGTVRVVHEMGSTFFDAEGHPVRRVGTVQDITERRQLEAHLRQAQKVEAVGQLAGGIAHEFNNLLQTILGFTLLSLDETAADDPGRRRLELVQSAAEKGGVLVKKVLAVGRKELLNTTQLELGRVIESALTLLRGTLNMSITLSYSPSPVPLVVKADAGSLEQVLLNLCLNARDAMPEGGRLTLSLCAVQCNAESLAKHPGAPPGAYASLTVQDTGEGIAPKVLGRIFEPFFSTKGPQKGSGLGLSTVQGLLQQQGGLIDVESVLGAGATFRVLLPLIDGGEQSDVHSNVVSESSAPAPRRPVVLVVEDEPLVREQVAEILGGMGFDVQEAANGLEALVYLRAHGDRLTLLVVDLIMPEMGGWAFYEQARTMQPDLPVLFHSGYTDTTAIEMEIEAAGLRLLKKPYSPNELRSAVRELVGEALAQAAPGGGERAQ